MSVSRRIDISDAPLSHCKSDKFHRTEFAESIIPLLLTEIKNKEGGLRKFSSMNSVIGLNGSWGSGKSTIINFVDEILSSYDPIVVIRFQPWLLANDLDSVKHFFSLISSAVDERKPILKEDAKRIKRAFARYAEAGGWLASIATGVPGLAQLAKSLIQSDNSISVGSVSKQKKELQDTLEDVGIPIVILIDEMDRLEDDEIRNVMRLLKSIIDIRGISSLVAYDFDRVAQALSQSGNPERGVRYLEKIMGINIQVPILLENDRRQLLLSHLTEAGLYSDSTVNIKKPEHIRSKKKYNEFLADNNLYFENLVEIIFSGIINTPRDMQRFISTFEYQLSAIKNPSSWIDLLAFSALSCKSPNIVNQIYQQPYELAAGEEKEFDRVFSTKKMKYCDLETAGRYGFTFNSDAEANLFAFLFDRFASVSINKDFGVDRFSHSAHLASVMCPGSRATEM